MKTWLLINLILLSLSPAASATTTDQYNQLFLRQEILHREYRAIYQSLTDVNDHEALIMWYRKFNQDSSNRSQYERAMKRLSQSVLGRDYRQLIYYYSVSGQPEKAKASLGFYYISAHTLIDNFLNDPQAQKSYPHLVRKIERDHRPLPLDEVKNIETCFLDHLTSSSLQKLFDLERSRFISQAVSECLQTNAWVHDITRNLQDIFLRNDYSGAPFPVTFAGFVGGNKVTLHTDTPMKEYDILNLGEQLNLILNSNPMDRNIMYRDLGVEDYKNLMPTPEAAINNLFTTEEGFSNTIASHSLFNTAHTTLGPVSDQNLGIYGQMLSAIRDAKESVFIDIFWMGGSIGMNLAKELMRKVIENPEFTVVIVTDRENKFQYGAELDLVYRYMRAFSEKFIEFNFYIAPAQLNFKRTALPEFIDLLISSNMIQQLESNADIKSFLERDGYHLLAKSDHSKVIVVDGKSPDTGRAFVGSKNWTDSSGGVNFDEVAEVQGPGAALILNSFYYDALEAFILDMKSQSSMAFNHSQAKFPNLEPEKAVEKLLAPIDVINRHSGKPQYNLPFIAKGDTIIAPAQNNIYGTEMSPREQNVQAILGARHQILIDDQFLFDLHIVEALKRAITQNGVKVFIILESLLPNVVRNDIAAHIPNNLFLPELVDLGVQVKWQLTPSSVLYAMVEDSNKHPDQSLTATFHVKSLSIDGVLEGDQATCNGSTPLISEKESSAPLVISGSANKDVLTMSGGFREYQVVSYADAPVISHDCLFWERWNDPDTTTATDGLDFSLPPQAEEFGITNKRSFLHFLKQLLFTPYHFSKDFTESNQ